MDQDRGPRVTHGASTMMLQIASRMSTSRRVEQTPSTLAWLESAKRHRRGIGPPRKESSLVAIYGRSQVAWPTA